MKLLGASFHPESGVPIIIMEFVEGGTLKELLLSAVTISWNERIQLLEDIALGIKDLHKHDPQVCMME